MKSAKEVTMEQLVIAYDMGTTGVKACVYDISRGIKYVAGEKANYSLYILQGGGAEQDPDQWWEAMCKTTASLLRKPGIEGSKICGISFCAQMQALVLVDKEGKPVRRAMSYMDNRAGRQLQEGLGRGLRISGMNAGKVWSSIRRTGAVSASVKDPVWKYRWVADEEPQVFQRVHKWLDVKDYLVCRATGEFTMSHDSAFATLLYDTKKKEFSREVCHMMKVDLDHLPRICQSWDMVGPLTAKAAEELGLPAGTKVFSGGGDASLIGLGAGAVSPTDTHVYMGTSGWVSTVTEKQVLDIRTKIASIVGVDPDAFHCFAELETAGKCLEWAKNNIGVEGLGPLEERTYEDVMERIGKVPAGSNGVIFTPWLHGNRNPFEDPNAAGMFFNLSLETTGRDMIHAVIEGVCFHLKWQLLAMEKKVTVSENVKFVGGGALSPLTCTILADILDRTVETVDQPQNVGAAGAAMLISMGMGKIGGVGEVKELIPVKRIYRPSKNTELYQAYFEEFKNLYLNNKNSFRVLNEGRR
ncbi:MAG: xylulokinase [Anaerovoracaceae bacterium]|jgi:xylulokinase